MRLNYTLMQKHNTANKQSIVSEIKNLIQAKMVSSGLIIERRQMIVIVLLAVLLAIGIFTLYRTSQPREVTIMPAGVNNSTSNTLTTQKKTTANKNAVSTSSTTTTMPLIVVHVAGAVAHPGVYRLADNSRVADAIIAAGKERTEADINALNLASRITDGQKIYVPKIGEKESENTLSTQSNNITSPELQALPSAETNSQQKFDLNSATISQLDTLPGVGQVTAQRIIDFRTKIGKFKRIDELQEIDGIGQKKYEQIKNLLIIR